MSTSTQGIVYGMHGYGLNRYGRRVSRGAIQGYHDKPHPLFLNKTAFRADIEGLKKVTQKAAIKIDGSEFTSRFTIGMEVEKNQLHRGAVREYELLCGFERDGSCGYEAVTHILPLLPSGKWRTKVYDMMHKAERIIDDRFSPSDKRCGGHITVGVDGMTGSQLRDLIRVNAGILYAMFRNRLKNGYCCYNSRMQDAQSCANWHSKYQVSLAKDYCLEFRLPSRFESVKQMMRRYELMYELVNFSVNKPNGKYEDFLKIIRPIIVSMYNGDVTKAEEILSLSKEFRTYILKGTITDAIRPYLYL
jgi:hypothetical protein